MELISLIVLAILGVVGAACSRVLADEFKSWSPWLIDRLINQAASKLPKEMQERYHEEWHSYINDIPGEVGKIVMAFNLRGTAAKLNMSPAFYERLWAASGILLLLPLMFVVVLFCWDYKSIRIFERVKSDGRYEKSADGQVTVFATRGPGGEMARKTSLDRLPYLFDVVSGRAMLTVPFKEFCKDLIDDVKRYLNR